MLQKIRQMFEPKYLTWEEYSSRIAFLELFYFQQKCRKESIKNQIEAEINHCQSGQASLMVINGGC